MISNRQSDGDREFHNNLGKGTEEHVEFICYHEIVRAWARVTPQLELKLELLP